MYRYLVFLQKRTLRVNVPVFEYLKKENKSKMFFNPTFFGFYRNKHFVNVYWYYLYPDVKKELLSKMPDPRGNSAQ